MDVLRTPDERFDGLPGYPFAPNYAIVESARVPPVRMHYVDAGPADGPVVVLLHGQPTWSFMYRSVIGVLADSGMRVIAPDNVGFGRSDKLTERHGLHLPAPHRLGPRPGRPASTCAR